MNVKDIIQPTITNSKQVAFYKTIEDVGLRIFTLKDEPEEALQDFIPFVDFIKDEIIQKKFIDTLFELARRYKIEGVDPDKLLFSLCKFDKYIEYNDELEEEWWI